MIGIFIVFICFLLESSLNLWIIGNDLEMSLDKVTMYLSYGGPALGVLLAYKLSRIQNLTFVNLMFFFFFCVDSLLGFIQIFNLEKLQREK